MSLFSAAIQRGVRGSQPAATTVIVGTLYCVTDESGIIERSNGTAWESYSPSAGGGAVADSAITFTDITTNNVTSTKHGFAPKSPASATQFLNGAATPAFAAVKDSDLSTTDITTNNVVSTKHGFAPKSPADATQFLNGAATPAFAAVKDSDLSTTDITTNNVTSTKHGFSPKSPADATQFLNGAATPAFAAVKDSDLSTSDITTNDVSITKHGFTPKAPNDSTKFLRGDATWAVPGGGASGILTATLDLTNGNLDNGNSTPLDIVAAPGANKVIIVVSAVFYCNVSVSKGANPSQRLRWTGDTTPVVDFAVGPASINMPLNSTGENWRYVLSNVSSAATPSAPNAWANTTFDPRNKAVQWSMSVNTATGTGTAKVRVAYYVLDFS